MNVCVCVFFPPFHVVHMELKRDGKDERMSYEWMSVCVCRRVHMK